MNKMIIGAAVFTPAPVRFAASVRLWARALRKHEAMFDRMPEDFPPSG